MIDKVDSETSLSFEDVFPRVSFTAKILLLINQVFIEKKDSYCYLLLDSLEIIVDLIHKEGGGTGYINYT